jgi:glycosyltransferase involved in cell wall biosynthesis
MPGERLTMNCLRGKTQNPLLLLMPYDSFSGMELFGLRFARDLQEHGNRVVVASPPGSAIERQAREWGLPRCEIPRGNWAIARHFTSFSQSILDVAPSGIIGFRTKAGYYAHLACLLHRIHIPLVLLYRLGAGNSFRRDPIHRVFFKNMAMVIPNAEHVRKKIVKYWGISPEKVVCIRSGIDLRKYFHSVERRKKLRDTLSLTEKDLVVGCTGRIHPEKGSEILIHTLFGEQGLAKSVPGTHLLLVGKEYAPGYAMYLQSLAKRLGFSDNLHILPFEPHVEEVYSGFDVFAFPVISHETYAYVALEAMASELPCVLPYVGGMKEMLIDGQSGLYFPHQDQEQFRSTLKKTLLMPKNERALLGAAARQRIVMFGNWETMMLEYVQQFKKLNIPLHYPQ